MMIRLVCAGNGGQIRAKSSPRWSWARNHGFGSSGELEDDEDDDDKDDEEDDDDKDHVQDYF